MEYFPLFVQIQHKKIFVAGGGKVAYRKCRTLLEFGCDITVFAKEVLPSFSMLEGTNIVEGTIDENGLKELLAEYDIVIAATSIREINHKIADICHTLKIPVNVADSKEESTFLFPAVVKRDALVIGISTSGKVPAMSGWLRKRLEQLFAPETGELVQHLHEYEMRLQKEKVKSKDRAKLINRQLEASFLGSCFDID